MIIFYVPCKDKKEARMIVRKLLTDKLIACGNILQSESIYEWKGEQKQESEAIALIKTLDRHEEEVKEKIKELHSYKVPAIIKIAGKANNEYLDWMEREIK